MKLFRKNKVTSAINSIEQNQQADNYLTAAVNAARNILARATGGSFGISPDGKRNYNQLFGYGDELTYEDYKGMYERGGYAQTVVELFPNYCWRDDVEVKLNDKRVMEDEVSELVTIGLLSALEKADIANRIGSFSVLFIGIPDGLDPELPIGSAKKGDYEGIYFNVYEEDGITVAQSDTDPASPRYGLPLIYTLQTTSNQDSRLQSNHTSRRVHYSRVVHMAEGSLSNKLEGKSSLKAPWNALTNKNKITGADAESYYRNSRQKMALEVNPGAKISGNQAERDALKENVENFQNGFEDTLRLNNMTANMMQPSIVSPRDSFDVNTEDVAGTSRIPVRFLTTKAGGSVTGSEDKAALNNVVADRQKGECSGWLMSALKSLDESGLITIPDGASISWPPQQSSNEKEAAETTKLKAEAFKAVTEALSVIGADDVVTESAFKEVGLGDIEIQTADFSAKDDSLVG